MAEPISTRGLPRRRERTSRKFSESPSPETAIHGVLVEVYGLGVLLVGDSGIGKSQCALNLIRRGHKLISDDSVLIKRVGERLQGRSPENIRDLMEIRGLGIVNARDAFGISALAESAKIGLCINLVKYSNNITEGRFGRDASDLTILGIAIPTFTLNANPVEVLAISLESICRGSDTLK